MTQRGRALTGFSLVRKKERWEFFLLVAFSVSLSEEGKSDFPSLSCLLSTAFLSPLRYAGGRLY